MNTINIVFRVSVIALLTWCGYELHALNRNMPSNSRTDELLGKISVNIAYIADHTMESRKILEKLREDGLRSEGNRLREFLERR